MMLGVDLTDFMCQLGVEANLLQWQWPSGHWVFLLQRRSVAIKRGSTVAVLGTVEFTANKLDAGFIDSGHTV